MRPGRRLGLPSASASAWTNSPPNSSKIAWAIASASLALKQGWVHHNHGGIIRLLFEGAAGTFTHYHIPFP